MKVDIFKLRLITNDDHIKAIACITVDEVAINDIRIVEQDGRLLVTMPSRMDKAGKYHDTAHPTTKELRRTIEQAVCSAYLHAIYAQRHDVEE